MDGHATPAFQPEVPERGFESVTHGGGDEYEIQTYDDAGGATDDAAFIVMVP